MSNEKNDTNINNITRRRDEIQGLKPDKFLYSIYFASWRLCVEFFTFCRISEEIV